MFNGSSDYLTDTRLTGDQTNRFTVAYPNGSKDVYGFIVTNNSGVFLKAYMTERWNAQGQKFRLDYDSYRATHRTHGANGKVVWRTGRILDYEHSSTPPE